MPCVLLSGLPGNGKTLRLLQRVERLRRESGRPVYFFDIKRKGHALSAWIPLGDESTFGRRKERIEPDLTEVRRWHEVVPTGAILVIDEAWFVFPKRGPASAVPKHVEELATHRHRGVDIFLSSQHATNQLDHFVRGLIQEHEHVIRLFGSERARVHKWTQGIGDPSDYHSRKQSVTEIWKYPTEVYEWYQSAEVHTIKRRVPWKPVLTIGGGLAAVAGLGGLAYSTLFGNVEAVAEAGQGVGKALDPASVFVSSAAASTVDDFVPQLPVAPFTAPFYAPAVKVTQAPKVSGCMMLTYSTGRIDCRCSTQQGTRVEMSIRECARQLENGSFDFDREDDYYPKIPPYVPALAEPADAPRQAPQGPSGAAAADDVLTEGG